MTLVIGICIWLFFHTDESPVPPPLSRGRIPRKHEIAYKAQIRRPRDHLRFGFGRVSESTLETVNISCGRKTTLFDYSDNFCADQPTKVNVSVKIGESCVASVSSTRFTANRATLRCQFAFSADFVPQLVIDLIADTWYWRKSETDNVMEMMMDE